jgi:hypothetical protein
LINRVLAAPTHDLDATSIPNIEGLSEEAAAEIRAGILQAVQTRKSEAEAHQASMGELRAAGPTDMGCWIIADQERDLHALEGLIALGDALPDLAEL